MRLPRVLLATLLLTVLVVAVRADHSDTHSPYRDDGGCCSKRKRWCDLDSGVDEERCEDLFDCLYTDEVSNVQENTRKRVCAASGSEEGRFMCNRNGNCNSERKAWCDAGESNLDRCREFNECRDPGSTSCGTEETRNELYRSVCEKTLERKCRSQLDSLCDNRGSLDRCQEWRECMLLPVFSAESEEATECELNVLDPDGFAYECGDCGSKQSSFCSELFAARSAETASKDDDFKSACNSFLACAEPGDQSTFDVCESPDFFVLGQYCNCGLSALQWILVVGGSALALTGAVAGVAYVRKGGKIGGCSIRKKYPKANAYDPAQPYAFTAGLATSPGQMQSPGAVGFVGAGTGPVVSDMPFTKAYGSNYSTGSRGHGSSGRHRSHGSRGRSGSHGSRGRSGSHGSRGRSGSKGKRH